MSVNIQTDTGLKRISNGYQELTVGDIITALNYTPADKSELDNLTVQVNKLLSDIGKLFTLSNISTTLADQNHHEIEDLKTQIESLKTGVLEWKQVTTLGE